MRLFGKQQKDDLRRIFGQRPVMQPTIASGIHKRQMSSHQRVEGRTRWLIYISSNEVPVRFLGIWPRASRIGAFRNQAVGIGFAILIELVVPNCGSICVEELTIVHLSPSLTYTWTLRSIVLHRIAEYYLRHPL